MKFGIVNITSFCNQKCIFCSEGDMHNTPKHIPFKKVIEILDSLKNNGTEGVNFMGGECTMRSDLGEILDYCNDNFLFVSIVTNGVMFSNQKWCETILGQVDTFEFSWHTNDEKKFSLLSGSHTYNLFQKSLQNIGSILKENLALGITINHVINQVNYTDLRSFVEETSHVFPLKGRKNRIIALKRTNIIGYSLTNKDQLSVCPSQVLPYLYDAVHFCIHNQICVQIEGFPPCYFGDFLNSPYFFVNEMEFGNLYLLNKIDISQVKDVSGHLKSHDFHSHIYIGGDKNLKIQILKKCKGCFFRKGCHRDILLGEDANTLSENILPLIGTHQISREDMKYNIIKRNTFLQSLSRESSSGNILK